LGLSGKMKLKEPEGNIFNFFVLIAFFTLLTVFSIPVHPAAGGGNPMSPEAGEGESVLITDFFSDHELCDATVLFEQPLENVTLRFTLSSGKELLRSENLTLGSVEAGQEVTKIHFWELEEDFGKDYESYTARLSVQEKNEVLTTRKSSFSQRSPTLSRIKLVDFSADSEKASALISPTELSFMQMPEPSMIDLNLKLLSEGEIVYSESMENIPVMESYYEAIYWPFLLEKDRSYTALLKVNSHSSLISVYRSDFRAKEAVEILEEDVEVDEYGASVTVVGKSQVPFDGIIRVVLTPENGEAQIYEETADILTAMREDTVGIIWQGIPRGDYNVMIYVVNLEDEVLDSYETVLRVFEPVELAAPVEESPGPGILAAIGTFLSLTAVIGRKRRRDN
jgi:hypothetical protein